AARARGGERVAALGDFHGHQLGRFLYGVGVVDAARLGAQLGAQGFRRNLWDIRANIDRAEVILFAFLDGEGDDEPLLGGVVFSGGRNDADVDIAVFEVVAAQQVTVHLDPVGIIDVVRLQEAQKIRLAGLDDVLEASIGKRPVADENDLGDAGLGAFV